MLGRDMGGPSEMVVWLTALGLSWKITAYVSQFSL